MCAAHNILYDGREPLIGFVAEGQEGEGILGASYAHKAAIIDPFICPNQPTPALKLFCMTEGALNALDFTNIVVQVNDDNSKLISELARMGFERVMSRYAIFKKVV